MDNIVANLFRFRVFYIFVSLLIINETKAYVPPAAAPSVSSLISDIKGAKDTAAKRVILHKIALDISPKFLEHQSLENLQRLRAEIQNLYDSLAAEHTFRWAAPLLSADVQLAGDLLNNIDDAIELKLRQLPTGALIQLKGALMDAGTEGPSPTTLTELKAKLQKKGLLTTHEKVFRELSGKQESAVNAAIRKLSGEIKAESDRPGVARPDLSEIKAVAMRLKLAKKEPLERLPANFSSLSQADQARALRANLDQYLSSRTVVDDGVRSAANQGNLKKSEGDAFWFIQELRKRGVTIDDVNAKNSKYWTEFGKLVRDNPDRSIRCDGAAALVVASLKEMEYQGPIHVLEQGPGNMTGHFLVTIGQTNNISYEDAKKGKWDPHAITLDLWGVAARKYRGEENSGSIVDSPPQLLWSMGKSAERNALTWHKID